MTKLLEQGLDQVLAVVSGLGNGMIKVAAPTIGMAATDPRPPPDTATLPRRRAGESPCLLSA